MWMNNAYGYGGQGYPLANSLRAYGNQFMLNNRFNTGPVGTVPGTAAPTPAATPSQPTPSTTQPTPGDAPWGSWAPPATPGAATGGGLAATGGLPLGGATYGVPLVSGGGVDMSGRPIAGNWGAGTGMPSWFDAGNYGVQNMGVPRSY